MSLATASLERERQMKNGNHLNEPPASSLLYLMGKIRIKEASLNLNPHHQTRMTLNCFPIMYVHFTPDSPSGTSLYNLFFILGVRTYVPSRCY